MRTLAHMSVRWCSFVSKTCGERDGEKDKVYLPHITPEAGTVKGRRYREVPLHPHLVKMGFPAFVGASKVPIYCPRRTVRIGHLIAISATEQRICRPDNL